MFGSGRTFLSGCQPRFFVGFKGASEEEVYSVRDGGLSCPETSWGSRDPILGHTIIMVPMGGGQGWLPWQAISQWRQGWKAVSSYSRWSHWPLSPFLFFLLLCSLAFTLYPSLTFLSIVKHMTSVPAMGPRSLSSSPGNVLLNLNMAQSSATQAHLADHLSEENRKKEPIFKVAYICIIILWKLHENLTTGKEERPIWECRHVPCRGRHMVSLHIAWFWTMQINCLFKIF